MTAETEMAAVRAELIDLRSLFRQHEARQEQVISELRASINITSTELPVLRQQVSNITLRLDQQTKQMASYYVDNRRSLEKMAQGLDELKEEHAAQAGIIRFASASMKFFLALAGLVFTFAQVYPIIRNGMLP